MRKRSVRLIAVLLALVLLGSTLPTALAYGTCSAWAKPSLDEMDSKGLLPSSMDDADMTLDITRLELCQMAVLAYKAVTGRDQTPQKTNYFKDTADADVCVAYELGIVSGYTDGTFRPNNKLTRQEMFVIIYNLFKSVGWTEDEIQELFDSFADSGLVGTWAKESTKIMLEIGVTYGTGDNYISPQGTASVEQALAMFLRAYNYIGDWQASFLPETGEEKPEILPLETHCYSNVSGWAKSDVDTIEALGFIPACLNGANFTRNITREEMCEIAVLAYQSITGDTHKPFANYFSDTENPNINLAYEYMIVSGYTDGTFRPNNNITRQEMFSIIFNLLSAVGWEKYDNTHELFAQYSDSGSIGSFAMTAAKTMLQLDIVSGNGSGKLLPLSSCSRQEAVSMFCRAYRYINLWYSEHPLDPDSYPGGVHIVSPTAEALVELAKQQLGKPYVYGNEGPNSFDCSGLVWWLYKQFGYSLGRTATAQWKNGVQVSKENLLPGDLVFFTASPGGAYISHVGIYIGDGIFLHAANSSRGVVTDRLDSSWYSARFYGARRIIY